jgi:hypothetical protein
MLKIIIPAVEQYDEVKEEFITSKAVELQVEHSLVSMSKWESKWCEPFLSSNDHSKEKTVDYIRCMTITQNVNPEIYLGIGSSIIEQINEYIALPMTATTVRDLGQKKSRMIVTSEVIYSWMIALTIPFECQKWHLNRLLTLIKVCNAQNSPPRKMSRKEIMARNSELNAARRQSMNSKG